MREQQSRPPFSSLSPFLSFPHGLCTFSSWDRFFPTLLRTPPKVRGRQGPERGSDSSSLFGKWSQEALEGVVSDSEGEEARSGHAHKGIYGQLGFPPAGDCRDHPKCPSRGPGCCGFICQLLAVTGWGLLGGMLTHSTSACKRRRWGWRASWGCVWGTEASTQDGGGGERENPTGLL